MALVPTRPDPPSPRTAPRPPARLPHEQRARLRQTVEAALAGLEPDAVLLAGSITDAIAALGTGLWTPAHASRPLPRASAPAHIASQLGLTLHQAPDWHLAEARAIAGKRSDVGSRLERERAARLIAAAAAARRAGATRVLAGAGAACLHPEGGLPLATARACVERYGLRLLTPFADASVQALVGELDERWTAGRWRGRSWPAWALREAFACRLSPGLAWPMRGPGEHRERFSGSPSHGEGDGPTARGSSERLDR